MKKTIWVCAITLAAPLIIFCQKPYKGDTTKHGSGSFSVRPSKEQKKIESQLQSKGFQFIQGGTFTIGDIPRIEKRPANDTTLIMNLDEPGHATVTSFYISKYEVTNHEYKEFTDWVTDSIALTIMARNDPSFYKNPALKLLDWSKREQIRDTNLFESLYPLYIQYTEIDKYANNNPSRYQYILNTDAIRFRINRDSAISVYPDTLCWLKEPSSFYNTSLVNHYFSHPSYKKYPVVGVSWEQANAYCIWLGRNGERTYRLPTYLEYTYCYSSIDFHKPKINPKPGVRSEELITKREPYPWLSSWTRNELIDEKGDYLANFGPIRDEYGVLIKDYAEDGAIFTAPVGAYPKSPTQLFDLAGNVAEWVQDGFYSSLRSDRFDKKFDSTKQKFARYANVIGPFEGRVIPLEFDSVAKFYFERVGKVSLFENWVKMGKPRSIEKPIDFVNFDQMIIYDVLSNTENTLTNFKIIQKLINPKKVVGGSWVDNPAFMRKGENRAYDASAQHSSIGFRVATDRY